MSVKIKDIFPQVPVVRGEVGIEIEIESRDSLPRAPEGWRKETDGSLRFGGAEYVLDRPVHRDRVGPLLNSLEDSIKASDARVFDAGHAGVHVHLNMQGNTIKEVILTACLYWMYEDLFSGICGDGRTGNLFCLSLNNAEGVISYVKECIQTKNYAALWNDRAIRYASVNFASLGKFGSLEFRAMGATHSAQRILVWVDILLGLKDAAVRLQEPSVLLGSFSVNGIVEFTKEIFGKNYEILFEGSDGWQEYVQNQMWEVQDLLMALSRCAEKRAESFYIFMNDIDEDAFGDEE